MSTTTVFATWAQLTGQLWENLDLDPDPDSLLTPAEKDRVNTLARARLTEAVNAILTPYQAQILGNGEILGEATCRDRFVEEVEQVTEQVREIDLSEVVAQALEQQAVPAAPAARKVSGQVDLPETGPVRVCARREPSTFTHGGWSTQYGLYVGTGADQRRLGTIRRDTYQPRTCAWVVFTGADQVNSYHSSLTRALTQGASSLLVKGY